MENRPVDISAERALISAIILDRQFCNDYLHKLKPEHFFYDSHKSIFTAIQTLDKDNRAIDTISIANALGTNLELCGGKSYLSELQADLMASLDGKSKYEIVIEQYQKRRILDICNLGIQQVYSGNPIEVSNWIDSEVINLVSNSYNSSYVRPVDRMDSILEKIIKARSGKVGISTGFPMTLDSILIGFIAPKVYYLGGDSGAGKSAVAMQMIKANLNTGKRVLLASTEMDIESITYRAFSSNFGISEIKMRAGWTSEMNLADLKAGISKVKQDYNNFFIEDSNNLTVAKIRSTAKQLQRDEGLDLLVIDYLQELHTEAKSNNRDQELRIIVHEIRQMALELNVPVLVLSSLSRDFQRSKRFPNKSDFRDSGNIEYGADVCILLHRPGMKADDADKFDPNLTIVIVDKHKYGQCKTFEWTFHGETYTFSEGFIRPPQENEPEYKFKEK